MKFLDRIKLKLKSFEIKGSMGLYPKVKDKDVEQILLGGKNA